MQLADLNKISGQNDLISFIGEIESKHFRTNEDTGANPNTLLIWNLVRERAGLNKLSLEDLAKFCEKCKGYHMNKCRAS